MSECKKKEISSIEKSSVDVYVGLGSNLGDRELYLRKAMNTISQQPNIRGIEVSSIYETEPVGYTDQPDFLNAVAKFNTTMSPNGCLLMIQAIERNLERKRGIRFGPRTIDIDLLLYGDAIINSEQLIVPHPRMIERSFVVIPLMELEKDICIPEKGYLNNIINDLHGKEGMRIWKKRHWLTESAPIEN
jgi:2-amino-4-hydroxy-6-hydroxymethyldihydropteridine diphosphokinase